MQSQTYNYKVVRQFAIMTVVWGIVGMLVGVIAAAQLVWPELNAAEWLHFGHSAAPHQRGDLCVRWLCSLQRRTTASSVPATTLFRGPCCLHLLGLATGHPLGCDRPSARFYVFQGVCRA